MTAWLTLIGIGCDGRESLGARALSILDEAELVIGSARHLEAAGVDAAKRQEWPSPFSGALDMVLEKRGQPVVVLATGDPMHYGFGATLARRINPDEFRVLPQPSAFSLAAARLGWPLQDVDCRSLHGRPVETLHEALQPGARIIALTSNADGARAAMQLLIDRDYGDSPVWVLENLGGPDARMTATTAAEGVDGRYGDLNTLAIECRADAKATPLPCVPGLPDEAFTHDGQLTKREVRAMSLAALAPGPGQRLWDVGAGCGSVAIEWMRAARDASAIAFEHDEKRLGFIETNAKALGVPALAMIAGRVPVTLAGQPSPDAVFLGGAVADEAVFEACWDALSPGGRLVANAVTLEGEAALSARYQAYGGDLLRVEISHASPVGTRNAMRPRMAVTQWRAVKP